MSQTNGYEAVEPGGDLFEDDGDEIMEDDNSVAREDYSLQDAGIDSLGDIMAEGDTGEGPKFDINHINDEPTEIDQRDKADDAVDYADMDSDEELPDEEIAEENKLPELPQQDEDDDDLFGDNDFPSSFPDASDLPTTPDDQVDLNEIASEHDILSPKNVPAFEDNLTETEREALAEQQRLLRDLDFEKAPQTLDDNLLALLELEYPSYSRDKTPFWSEIFPHRALKWAGKTPLRPPKPIRPTKVNLELDVDQRTLFNSSSLAHSKPWEDDGGIVRIETATRKASEAELSDESDTDEETVNGLTMQDLEYLCVDLDTLSTITASEDEHSGHDVTIQNTIEAELFGAEDFMETNRPAKKRKIGPSAQDVVSTYFYEMPSFHDPEKTTRKLARKVVLDLSDPTLLLEEIDPEVARGRGRPGDAGTGAKSVKELLKGRFALSNDAEYDLLKQNHQHKVRGQLGALTVEHSSPALRLQFPFYKLKLSIKECRLFHRKKMFFKQLFFNFKKVNKVKRKSLKGKSVKEIYDRSSDLSLADNSNSLLLEYSEEHPFYLSATGMGNRIVNYYRRQTQDDTTRPKKDLGETQVLLPEDKSPFYMLGHVDPGETVTALYNALYRTPIFEHKHKPQDFLVLREETFEDGVAFYLRGIDHLFVAGQELPSKHIPKPHGRDVTAAHKNRLRAVCYRIARKKKTNRIKVEDVTKHFPGTSDMQNRQKMKEFMHFNREYKEWEMQNDAPVPDEEMIQGVLPPEEICRLDSLQVGQQYLQDAGFADEDVDDGDDDAKDSKKRLSLEQELAPWRLTKNFENASLSKAMLTLHGEGDPSGRGEAFSFIKTSMKGGYRSQGAPVQDALDKNQRRMTGGHSYNVADQQRLYEQDIRRIWNNQKQALEHQDEVEDDSIEDGVDGQDDNFAVNGDARAIPRSSTDTPAPFRRPDNETATSFSKRSTGSQTQRYLSITRMIVEKGVRRTETHIETNLAVIKRYEKIKTDQEAAAFE